MTLATAPTWISQAAARSMAQSNASHAANPFLAALQRFGSELSVAQQQAFMLFVLPPERRESGVAMLRFS